MKKLILLLLITVIPSIFSQTVSEKPIVKFSPYAELDGYNFKFDPVSGTYYYVQYDSTAKQYSIIGNRGNSERYGYIIGYNALFDDAGNYYHIANNNITDTTYTYFLLKNSKEIASFEMINENWRMNNGSIYFVCSEKGKTYLAVYNTKDGSLLKGKGYDDIILVYYEQSISEGEPEGEIGFMRDGRYYYVASENNEKFLVIDGVEQKHYSDIDSYYLREDTTGAMTYFAKRTGKFYEKAGDAFVVQGTKEYSKTCDYLYGPILFDKDNNPVCICGDSTADVYPQRVIHGEKEGKTYNGGVYNLIYTASGKLIYIATLVSGKNNDIYKSFTVINGTEGKKYGSISYFTLLPNDEPLYAGVRDADQSVIVRGNKEIETDYPNISDVQIMPNGKIAYVGAVYGDYQKKIRDRYYAVMGDDEMGPYDGMVVQNYEHNDYILFDTQGSYAFVIMNMKNITDYITTQQVVSAKYTSKEFDGIENLAFYKGKLLWKASKIANRENYTYTYQVYYDNKSVGKEYDYIGDYKFDDKTGKISFIGLYKNEFFTVEIQL